MSEDKTDIEKMRALLDELAAFMKKNDLAELWVHSEHQRKGVGTALFRKAEELIADAGFREMTVRSAAAGARPFYEATGCTVVGVSPCTNGPLAGWPLTHYRKDLAGPPS